MRHVHNIHARNLGKQIHRHQKGFTTTLFDIILVGVSYTIFIALFDVLLDVSFAILVKSTKVSFDLFHVDLFHNT
jgi:hypothetical protein